MEEQAERGGWIALLVGGIVNVIYGIAYLVWTLLSLATGGLVALMSVISAMDGGSLGEMIFPLISVLMPVVQGIVFLIVPLLGLFIIFAATRFKGYRSKGLVWMGILATVGGPALGLASSLLSCCNIACCGFLFGNTGTIVAGVLAVATAGYAAYCITREDVAARFAENDAE